MIEYVVGFAFSRYGNKVALIRKNKPDWQAGKLNGIGGKVEQDEYYFYAMVREFREETGVQTNNQDWDLVTTLTSNTWKMTVFKSFLEPEVFRSIRTIEEEVVEIHDTKELFTRMFEGTENTIHNIPMLLAMCLSDEQPPSAIIY